MGIKKNLNQYDIVQYALNYCLIDCEVLMNGYMKFREWMFEITNLDLDKYITLQSLANKFMIFSGCYEGVYQLSGTPQHFISQCIVGGRCMTNSNKMWHVSRKNGRS